jgi:isopenicillin-N N-acyltransferase-like protein
MLGDLVSGRENALGTVVQVRGTHREIGQAIGETARPQIQAAVEFYTANFSEAFGLSRDDAIATAHEHLRYARRYLPHLVEELEGMAEGSGSPFDDLLVLNCGEEISPMLQPPSPCDDDPSSGGGVQHCTAVAVSGTQARLVALNMDWYPDDADKNIFYDVTVPDGTRFISYAGAHYLPIVGMNSHGIAYAGNSFVCTQNRPGIPNAFVRRWVLEAQSLEEAVRRACHGARARGSNHLLGDVNGSIINLETSATSSALVDPDRTESAMWTAHTNHYLAMEMLPYEGYLPTWRSSFVRLERAREMIAEGLEANRKPVDVVMSTLRDHETEPFSVCEHDQEALPLADRSMTVASVVFDLASSTLHACPGQPCKSDYVTFEMG